jgi:acyl-CoA synthetase (AMP-forming)/AMP-acid ligase II
MITLDKICALNLVPGKQDQEAIVAGNTRLSWGEFEACTRRLVQHFAGKNYRRVLFLSENRAELLPLFSAFSTLGVSLTGVDYTSSLAQKLHSAQVVRADALVYSAAFAKDAAWLLRERPMDAFCIDSDLRDLPAADVMPTLSATPPCFESIAFTSGTTGLPKAVLRTKGFDARRFRDLIDMFGFDASQVFLATIPFYHVSVVGWARLALSLGGKVVISKVDDAAAMARDLHSERVTALLATPVVLAELLAELQEGKRPADLRFIITGGKHCPQDLKRRALDFFGPIVNEYYGTTETGVNAIATAADLMAYAASAGRLLGGNSVAILDDNNLPVSEGKTGRVAVHSYQNMDGYLNGPSANTVTIAGTTYLVTADFGYLRGNRVFLVNRTFAEATSLDLYGIEDKVRQIPGIKDVFSVSLGQRSVNVFIATDKHAWPQDIGARLGHLADAFAGIEIKAIYVERIPYSLSGKVRTSELILSGKGGRNRCAKHPSGRSGNGS